MFLIAVGFWNFLGAGVFGFLINLPIVSYYEIGTQFTANHGHGAMMGVYGMLAIGFFMFVARYFIPPDRTQRAGDEDLVLEPEHRPGRDALRQPGAGRHPPALRQLQNGYWHARSRSSSSSRWSRVFEWLRLPGDVLFIVGGILPVVYLALRASSSATARPLTKPASIQETSLLPRDLLQAFGRSLTRLPSTCSRPSINHWIACGKARHSCSKTRAASVSAVSPSSTGHVRWTMIGPLSYSFVQKCTVQPLTLHPAARTAS